MLFRSSVFIEHTAGWFPFWCAPEQVRVITVSSEVSDYVAKIMGELDKVELSEPIAENKLRYTVDDLSESLSKKIKKAVELKIPAIVVVGPKDAAEGVVSIRLKDGEEKVKLAELGKFLKSL